MQNFTDKKKGNLKFEKLILKHTSEINQIRINNCGTYLEFLGDSELISKKLSKSNFCGNRFCPMCSWRKSKKDALQISILMEYLKIEFEYEFIFLTLTAPNVRASELENEIIDFNESFKRLSERNEFVKMNKGYIRKLEVTYDKDEFITKELYKKKKDYYKNKGLKVGDKNPTYDTYNPHFHVVIAVNKSYFTDKTYISSSKMLELWRESKRDNRITQIKMQKATPKNNTSEVLEIAKYSAKDSEYTVSQEVFDVFYKALKGKRFFSYNKAFKKALSLYKNKELDYLKEKDANYYVYLLSYVWGWNIGNYEEFEFRKLSIEEINKYNNNLIEECENE